MKKIEKLKQTRIYASLMGVSAIPTGFIVTSHDVSESDGKILTVFFAMSIIFFQWAYISHLKIKLLTKEGDSLENTRTNHIN